MGFEGRSAALEWRMELARRVQDARPFHFSAVGLCTELHARLAALPAATLTEQEVVVKIEADRRTRQACAFWMLGQQDADAILERDIQQLLVPWVLDVFGFRFGWFSRVVAPRL